MPLTRTYIVANFKETQLDRMRRGQTVEISADAFPGRKIEGRIDSFARLAPAQGAVIDGDEGGAEALQTGIVLVAV